MISLSLISNKYLSFIIGRLVGFLLFYFLTIGRLRIKDWNIFLYFFMLFLINIIVSFFAEYSNLLPTQVMIYKIILDISLFIVNIIIISFIKNRYVNISNKPVKVE